jgi:hypothetical protein
MNARKKIASLMGGAAVIAGVVGMTAGLTPAAAVPSQTPGATLSIVDQNITGPGKNRVLLYGVFPMQEPDAVGFITHLMDNGCGGMHYIVLGDDGKEQYLFDRNFPGTSEDKDGTDEVFVRARFVDGDCVSRVQNTNVVKGNF